MSDKNTQNHAHLISELGTELYLKGKHGQQFSNIDIFNTGKWDECSGCHGTSYRTLKKQTTWNEFLGMLDSFSPALAGVVDGVQHQTVGKVERVSGGVHRTAEGLHITGADNFQRVADENYAAYEFSKTTFDKLISFDIDSIDNPVSQAVMAIVSEYINAIPEWVIEAILESGALIFKEHLDTSWLSKAHAIGVIQNTSQEDLMKAAKLLNGQRFVGKQVGKRLGKKMMIAISYSIAAWVTKKMMVDFAHSKNFKRKLVRMRKAAKPVKGGLGGAVLTLLGTQGYLNQAAQSSRRLQSSSPRVWNIMRYKLHGANMVYFLIEPMMSEYVYRLSLLEKNPKEFIKIMKVLYEGKKTQAIIFPIGL